MHRSSASRSLLFRHFSINCVNPTRCWRGQQNATQLHLLPYLSCLLIAAHVKPRRKNLSQLRCTKLQLVKGCIVVAGCPTHSRYSIVREKKNPNATWALISGSIGPPPSNQERVGTQPQLRILSDVNSGRVGFGKGAGCQPCDVVVRMR